MKALHRRRKTCMALGLAAAMGTLAACGSSSSGTTASASSSATTSSSASASASTAASASSSASSAAGTKSAPLTIGVAAITLGSPVVGEEVATIKQGAALLGWKVKVLNANANPTQMAADMSALVNQGVGAIIDLAIQPAQAQAGLQAAKAKGIPVLEVGAPVIDPSHLTAATYAPSDAHMADLLAAQMIKDYNGKGNALSLDASGIPAIVDRYNELVKKTSATSIKVVAKHETDLANPVADTQTADTDAIRANPNINMIWGLQDFEFSTSISTLASQHLTSKVGVYAFYLDPIDFGLLRAAKTTKQHLAVADSPIQYSPWYALDAFVNKFVLKKADWITPQSIKPLPYALVTPQNVQATGTTYHYPAFEPFFANRWTSEGVKVTS